MAETRDFNEVGSRWYDSSEPDLTRTGKPNFKVFSVLVLTDTVISATSVWAPGFSGDTAIFGKTLTPGRYYLSFSKFVATSGTGLVDLM